MLLLTLMPWALFSCGSEVSYTVYVGEGTASLDPKKCTSKAEETYISNLYSGLYEYVVDGDSYKLSPADAEGFPTVEETEEGKFVYTFTLKEGLKWSNGEPVTPEDYVTAWNDSAAYSLYTDKGYIFSLIDGYEAYTSYEDDAALNMTFDNKNRTFSVTVTENSERFLAYTTTSALFPTSKNARRDSTEWDTDPEFFASNGAYTLASISDDKLTIKKNEHYRNSDAVPADKITFIFDTQKAADMVSDERLDLAFTEKLSFGGYTDKVEVGIKYLAFNASDKSIGVFLPEHQRMIREAIGIYVRESGAFTGVPESLCPYLEAERTSSAQGSVGSSACDHADSLLETVAVESDLFTWQNGKAYEFPVLTVLSAGRDGEDRDLNELVDYLKEKGISLHIQNADWNTFLDMRDSGDYSMLINSWSYSTLSDGEFLRMFLSNSIYNDARLGAEADSTWESIYDSQLLFPISRLSNSAETFRTAYETLKAEKCLFALAKAERKIYIKDGVPLTVLRNGTVRFY